MNYFYFALALATLFAYRADSECLEAKVKTLENEVKTLKATDKGRLYVRSTAKVIYGREKLRKKEKPGAVAFAARFSEEKVTIESTLIWDVVTINDGEAYNKNTGIFTAPGDGVYEFLWGILAQHGTKSYTELVVGDKIMVRNHAESKKKDDLAMSNTASVIVRLKKGNKVWVRKHDGTLAVWGQFWSFYQGHKLY